MPHITDAPPADIRRELDGLSEALDAQIPARKLDENLLIATWNIRSFGGLTEKWNADEDDSPKRDLRALRFIGEVVRRFDVIAVQEVRSDLKALRHLLKLLGPHWSFILTDVNATSAGNHERLAFVFDTRRVHISGLACEVVMPNDGEFAMREQFVRPPYAVSFRSCGETFILVTTHVIYGDKAADRVGELQAFADWMGGWAREINTWGHNLIALGDFNIDKQHGDLHNAFTSSGLAVPDELVGPPRTIFQDPDEEHFYDQIAWFTEKKSKAPALSMRYRTGGMFDFVPYVTEKLSRTSMSWRVSDHYPLWVEFEV
ncbi:endonuclease [Persicimonas caeni]|uniref:Endonuclease n=1 Tax=Persicimonas caeni TaxID=2292766 RepID=A0A4Y6PPQ3_PERCE|nr:endonuclease/exonuclease/phosphatase family protein [Persicimonas caeni]QDG50193.1 endonuclease [Persicimonas caeni]QED31414.1 endonuclease [Persicimonas caeni]